MKLPKIFPSAIAWMNGGALFTLLQLVGLVGAVVLPPILELLERSPRLGVLCLLLFILSPAVVVAIVHHASSGALDRAEKRRGPRGLLPGITSVWAGAFGWLVMLGTIALTTFLMLLVYPPEPDAATAVLATFKAHATGGVAIGLQSLLWVFVASEMYHLERLARADSEST